MPVGATMKLRRIKPTTRAMLAHHKRGHEYFRKGVSGAYGQRARDELARETKARRKHARR